MSKEEVYKQIDNFVNQRVGKSKLYEIRFYVDTPTAEDRAKFVKWLFEEDETFKNKRFKSVIDLSYGSGNLTSHILYEANIEHELLILNDINISDRNNDIPIGTKAANDFLDAEKFDKQYDLIIFNPQIGGADTYPEGAVEFKKSVEPIVFNGSFAEYLSSQGIDLNPLDIDIDEINKKIFVHSDSLTKADMKKMFKDIQIFNYFDIFYQSKESKKEGIETNIVKFRKTLDKISKPDSVVIFLGDDSTYEALFADYTYSVIYLANEGKNLYVLSKEREPKKLCYEYKDNTYLLNGQCKKTTDTKEEDLDIDVYLEQLDDLKQHENSNELFSNKDGKERYTMTLKEYKEKLSTSEKGKLDFHYKNILFKGVPGTGKSRAIDQIIKNKLDIENQRENILRINIHSASSNADLMQGIGIATQNGQIEYKEKQGLIFDLIKRAIYHPHQPFVLILEEIQENSLNELIGDLIYLIEDEKRAKLKDLADDKEYAYQELIEKVIKESPSTKYVEIPYLVSDSTEYRKMILPDNLYIFCTSNYRDDKKVIEDNLLRRFEVIEIYPKKEVSSEYTREFFESLNKSIQKTFSDEIHPDRYMIGHAIWKNVKNKKDFYRALLKVVTEFKDIKEIEFETFKEVLKGVKLPENIDEDIIKQLSYYELIEMLQKKIDYGFID